MAYCRNCGADIGDAKYCPNCGTPQSGETTPVKEMPSSYTVRFERLRYSGASLVDTKVKLDGKLVGKIPNGGTLTVPVQRGVHQLEMQAGMNPKLVTTFIADGPDETIYLPFKLNAMARPVIQTNASPSKATTRGASVNANATHNTSTNAPAQPKIVNTNVQQPQKKMGCLLPLLALIAVGAIILNFWSLFGSDPKKPSSNTPSASPVEKQTEFQLGETLSYGDLDVTVNGFTFSDRLGNASNGGSTENGNRWCVVNVTLKNTGKEVIKLRSDILGMPSLDYHFKLYYDNDYEYLSSWGEVDFCIESREDLKPLEEATATTSFEVPREVEENTDKSLVVTFSKDSDGTEYTWPLR